MNARAGHVRRALAAGLLPVVLVLAACGSGGSSGAGGSPPTGHDRAGAELAHVHGLGIDPGSGALYVATHDGVLQAAARSSRLERVGTGRPDVMGLSVVGARHLLGSGHPGPGEQAPPDLGLVESRDGGRTWQAVALAGAADFHVLRARGRRVYGYNGATGELMLSGDRGRSWERRTPPAPMFDLAISPSDARRVVVSTERGVFASDDGGARWTLLRDDLAGLLAWPSAHALFLVDGRGGIWRSADGGPRFSRAGSIGGRPAAFTSGGGALFAALADGTVVRSADGGVRWAIRAKA